MRAGRHRRLPGGRNLVAVRMTAAELVLLGVCGAAFGSFVNVLAYRLPRRESIVKPRSRCPECGTTIRAYDNIPIVSWLLLRGRCRDCNVRIPVRYPLVELVTAILDELERIAIGLFPAWLPGATGITGTGGANVPAVRALALRAAAAIPRFAPFLADLAERSLRRTTGVRSRFAPEVRAGGLARVLATAYLGLVPADVDPSLPGDTAWHPVDELPEEQPATLQRRHHRRVQGPVCGGVLHVR